MAISCAQGQTPWRRIIDTETHTLNILKEESNTYSLSQPRNGTNVYCHQQGLSANFFSYFNLKWKKLSIYIIYWIGLCAYNIAPTKPHCCHNLFESFSSKPFQSASCIGFQCIRSVVQPPPSLVPGHSHRLRKIIIFNHRCMVLSGHTWLIGGFGEGGTTLWVEKWPSCEVRD